MASMRDGSNALAFRIPCAGQCEIGHMVKLALVKLWKFYAWGWTEDLPAQRPG